MEIGDYKLLQCATGTIRYVRDSDNQPWFALKDVFTALQVPTRTRTMRIFTDDEITTKIFKHRKLRRVYSLLCINQSGLFKVIMNSENRIFNRFKNWLADTVLASLCENNDYILRLMPYMQGMTDPEVLFSPKSKSNGKAVS